MRRRMLTWQIDCRGQDLGRLEAPDYETARVRTAAAIESGALPPDATVHPVIAGTVYPIETFLPDAYLEGDLPQVYPGATAASARRR